MRPPPPTSPRRPALRYFHGGVPGLGPGDLLLPPAVTGTDRTLTQTVLEKGGTARLDRVYVTTGREVAPEGELVPDPDCYVAGVSWECPAARVVRVVDPVVLARTRSVDAWLRRLARATDEAGKAAGEAL